MFIFWKCTKTMLYIIETNVKTREIHEERKKSNIVQ